MCELTNCIRELSISNNELSYGMEKWISAFSNHTYIESSVFKLESCLI